MPLTTLRAAGELVGVTPGMPTDVYRPVTPLVLDAPLEIEPDAAAILAGWLALGDQALERLAERAASRQARTALGSHALAGALRPRDQLVGGELRRLAG